MRDRLVYQGDEEFRQPTVKVWVGWVEEFKIREGPVREATRCLPPALGDQRLNADIPVLVLL
jgi:hypothetical protein